MLQANVKSCDVLHFTVSDMLDNVVENMVTRFEQSSEEALCFYLDRLTRLMGGKTWEQDPV
jgi:hypothetical protein